MTEFMYRQALIKLFDHDIELDYHFPQRREVVSKLERELGHVLPGSYRLMILEHGILGFDGKDIYGLGINNLKAQSPFNTFYSTMKARMRGEITDKMVKIMASGFGPFYVIDCAEIETEGHAPVMEIDERGYAFGMKKVAENFGEFLLNEVDQSVENG